MKYKIVVVRVAYCMYIEAMQPKVHSVYLGSFLPFHFLHFSHFLTKVLQIGAINQTKSSVYFSFVT